MRDPGEVETVIRSLRRAGLSKVRTIMFLVESGALSANDAKMMVHNSDAWRDVRDRDEAFIDSVAAAAEAIERGDLEGS